MYDHSWKHGSDLIREIDQIKAGKDVYTKGMGEAEALLPIPLLDLHHKYIDLLVEAEKVKRSTHNITPIRISTSMCEPQALQPIHILQSHSLAHILTDCARDGSWR